MDIGPLVLETIRQFLPVLIRLILLTFATLGSVYLVGRLLNICKTDLAKNIWAVVSMAGLAVVSVWGWDYQFRLEWVWPDWAQASLTAFIYSLTGFVLYVVLAWRFFDRSDSYLDRIFGKDKRVPRGRKKRK